MNLAGWQIMTHHGRSKQVCGNGICETPGDRYFDEVSQAWVINCYRDCEPELVDAHIDMNVTIPDQDDGWGTVYFDFGIVVVTLAL